METLPPGQSRDVLADLKGDPPLEDEDEFFSFVVILDPLVFGEGVDRDQVAPQVLVRPWFAERCVGIGIDPFLVTFGAALRRQDILLRLQFVHVQFQDTAALLIRVSGSPLSTK